MNKQTKLALFCIAMSMLCFAMGLLTKWNADAPKQPKYIFYFIGDGMGFNHILGTEQFNAIKEGKSEIERLNFMQFATRNFVTNYSTSSPVTSFMVA